MCYAQFHSVSQSDGWLLVISLGQSTFWKVNILWEVEGETLLLRFNLPYSLSENTEIFYYYVFAFVG